MKWFAAVLPVVVLSCTRLTPPGVMESCQATSDCQQGLVCLGSRCGECRQDSKCPGVAKCGLIQAGRCGCYDADGDGASCDDCDDADPARFPGANEVCDARDNDCDGEIDEGTVTTWFVDADGDGYGNAGLSVTRCAAPANFVARGGDCNDNDPTTFPGRSEVCDARDNDCDGEVDEGVKSTFYRDADGDGFGDARNSATTCQIPSSGFVSVATDCDDSRADANPQAMETCNNRDDDCDGVVDGQTRACNNACGDGMETCTRGVWGGCTAPTVLQVSSTLQVTSPTTLSCVVVGNNGRVAVAADTTLTLERWMRAEGTGVVELGPRAAVVTRGDLQFIEQSQLLGVEGRLEAEGTITLGPNARWFVQFPQAGIYSSGGSAACASVSNPTDATSGASGGARGGTGGRGGTCGTLQTLPRAGAGGPSAQAGVDGCACNCVTAPSSMTSGGSGGALLAGGGGGANGGAGGLGGGGRFGAQSSAGSTGGVAEPLAKPTAGGGAGGSGGTSFGPLAPEACQGTGGHAAGILTVRALRFRNEGLLSLDGAAGETGVGSTSLAGGGGGGAGGSVVLEVDVLDNRGAISAVGGRGGNARGATAGGGGGGGGGRIWLEGRDGGVAQVLLQGGLFVGGGVGGSGSGGTGDAGSPGWVRLMP